MPPPVARKALQTWHMWGRPGKGGEAAKRTTKPKVGGSNPLRRARKAPFGGAFCLLQTAPGAAPALSIHISSTNHSASEGTCCYWKGCAGGGACDRDAVVLDQTSVPSQLPERRSTLCLAGSATCDVPGEM